MAADIDLQKLWQAVNQALRRQPVSRAVWEAADAAVPLELDGEMLVLGFEPRDMRHASYLETTVNKARIQEILQAKTGKRLDVRCIEGTAPDTWENTKAREAEQQARTRAGFDHLRTHGTAITAWETLSHNLTNLFANTEARRLYTVQAATLVKVLPMVYETDTSARAADPDATAINDRELNRIMDKLATFADLPPTQVALEYLRYRGSRKAQSAS